MNPTEGQYDAPIPEISSGSSVENLMGLPFTGIELVLMLVFAATLIVLGFVLHRIAR